MREHYQVNEIFTSVQGEGYWTGKPCTFIRLQGCMVGCIWCDTKYTWFKGGTRMTVGEIIAKVDTPHAVITGGEPTMYDLDALIVALKMTGSYVQLETSGQNELKGEQYPHWITVSPKYNLRFDIANGLLKGNHVGEIKWVVDDELKWDPVLLLWEWFELRDEILTPWFYFMPEGCPSRPEMMKKTLDWLLFAPSTMQEKFRICDRLQYRLGVR